MLKSSQIWLSFKVHYTLERRARCKAVHPARHRATHKAEHLCSWPRGDMTPLVTPICLSAETGHDKGYKPLIFYEHSACMNNPRQYCKCRGSIAASGPFGLSAKYPRTQRYGPNAKLQVTTAASDVSRRHRPTEHSLG